MRLLLVLIIIFSLIISCAPTLRFDQTCVNCIKSQRLLCKGDECPSTFLDGADCIVSIIETGENIYLNLILKKEGIGLKENIPICIAKANGKFFLCGEKFKNLWILYPKINNKAKFFPIELTSGEIKKPVFSFNKNLLQLKGDNLKKKTYIIDPESNELTEIEK